MVLFFTIATIVLSTWALIGSYTNQHYLTENYLLSFQLSNLNVSALLHEVAQNNKRDLGHAYILDVPIDSSGIALKAIDDKQNGAVLDVNKRASELNVDLLTSMLASLTTLQPSQVTDLASLTSGISVPTSQLASLASVASLPTAELASLASTVDPLQIVSELQQVASTLSIPSSLATLAAGFSGNEADLLKEIARNVNSSQLGLSDMYSIGYWGYCKGSVKGIKDQIPELGSFGTQFSNKDVNFTYCSPPRVGFTFDPLLLLKQEITAKIVETGEQVKSGPLDVIVQSLVNQTVTLVNLMTYTTLNLPGDLETALPLLGRITKAGFGSLLAGAAIAFLSLCFQLVGMFCSPGKTILSCCNFFIMVLAFIGVILGSGLTTGVYIYVRKTLNNEVKQFGIYSFLSVQYYAFAWSAAAAALCMVIFSLVGYCCGCFRSDRQKIRGHEPEFRYDHQKY